MYINQNVYSKMRKGTDKNDGSLQILLPLFRSVLPEPATSEIKGVTKYSATETFAALAASEIPIDILQIFFLEIMPRPNGELLSPGKSQGQELQYSSASPVFMNAWEIPYDQWHLEIDDPIAAQLYGQGFAKYAGNRTQLFYFYREWYDMLPEDFVDVVQNPKNQHFPKVYPFRKTLDSKNDEGRPNAAPHNWWNDMSYPARASVLGTWLWSKDSKFIVRNVIDFGGSEPYRPYLTDKAENAAVAAKRLEALFAGLKDK